MGIMYSVIGAVGYHRLKLIDIEKEKEFEDFIMNELLPAYNSTFVGQKIMLAKADRGAEKGNYSLLLLFDNVDKRDAYYPENGHVSDEVKALWDSPEIQRVDKKLKEYAGREFVTDYVTMNNTPAYTETY